MATPSSLVAYALAVLAEPDAHAKVTLTRAALAAWRAGVLPCWAASDGSPPDRPARSAALHVVAPGVAPKRGRGGTPESRLALLHSLAHIESWAVDLAWDAVARFGRDPALGEPFCAAFAIVAEDEARHFEALAARLTALGSSYGALPVHDGLWESATRTAHSAAARLAVEHCCHEARGIDILPQTIRRFRAGGDEATAVLLEQVILPEEVDHCRKGVHFFKALQGEGDAAAAFHACIRAHFDGPLKPPFNTAARTAAGLEEAWYLPLACKG